MGRDDSGKLLLAWAEQLDLGNSLLGEAKVVWCAIKFVAMEGYRNIILEGDALNVIDPLKSVDSVPTGVSNPYLMILCIYLNLL